MTRSRGTPLQYVYSSTEYHIYPSLLPSLTHTHTHTEPAHPHPQSAFLFFLFVSCVSCLAKTSGTVSYCKARRRHGEHASPWRRQRKSLPLLYDITTAGGVGEGRGGGELQITEKKRKNQNHFVFVKGVHIFSKRKKCVKKNKGLNFFYKIIEGKSSRFFYCYDIT